jgi:hypothetical protein
MLPFFVFFIIFFFIIYFSLSLLWIGIVGGCGNSESFLKYYYKESIIKSNGSISVANEGVPRN